MTETVYQGYDRAALDAQYDNRAAVPDHKDYTARWAVDCAAVLEDFNSRLDVAYGTADGETLDIFPTATEDPAPVLVYYHGGYWMSRDKSDFIFFARTFVPAGAALVVVNYGLIPSVDMDELVRQCRNALSWVHANAASFGGDAGRIHVAGHSAGGHLVAMMMTTDWPAVGGLPRDLVKGGCAISGLYDLEPMALCYLQDTLGLSAEQVARNSPLHLMPATTAPLVIAVGGAESDEFHRQGATLAAAWRGHGVPCSEIERPGLNHFSILADFAEPDSPTTAALLAQMGMG
jgi:arylformamidase